MILKSIHIFFAFFLASMVEVPQAAILVGEVTVLVVAEDLEVVEAGEKVRKVPNVRKISNLLLISTTYQIFFSKENDTLNNIKRKATVKILKQLNVRGGN